MSVAMYLMFAIISAIIFVGVILYIGIKTDMDTLTIFAGVLFALCCAAIWWVVWIALCIQGAIILLAHVCKKIDKKRGIR